MVTAGSRLDWPIGVKNRNQRLCVSEVDFLTQMFGYTARVQRDNESSPEHTRRNGCSRTGRCAAAFFPGHHGG